MARLFDDANSEALKNSNAVVSSTGITMACWAYTNDLAVGNPQYLMGIFDESSVSSRALYLDTDVNVEYISSQSGGQSIARGTTSLSANTWYHFVGQEAAANSREVFVNGTSEDTDAGSETPSGLDVTAIGAEYNNSSPGNYLSGGVAEAAIWDVILTQAEINALAAGASPLFIRPESIVAYWPLIRGKNDWIGGYDLTDDAAPDVTTHPPQVVHPTITLLSPPITGVEQVTPNTVFGLGLVNNIFILPVIVGQGSVFTPFVQSTITIPDQRPTIATPGIAEYKVRIKNQAGESVAELDNWISLNFTHKVNHRGSCRLEINGEDDRIQYLIPDSNNIDNQIEVWRRNPAVDLDWYIEWEGLLRTNNDLFEQNDNNKLVAFGFSYLDLARRAEVKWAAGSSQADKSGVGETLLKNYVSENIGPGALAASGRAADNVMPGLSIQADLGLGTSWSGAMADKKLLATLQEIAIATGIDFDIIGIGAALFQFVTYNGQKTDRTVTNTAGNAPVIFSLGFGNIIVPLLSKNRTNEVTAAYAIGKGTDDARQSALVESDAVNDSPWNRIEETTSASNTSGDDLESAAEALLEDKTLDIKLTFQVLQTLSAYYGKHYTWGDLVTAQYKEESFDKKVTEVNVTISGNSDGERIGITFADR